MEWPQFPASTASCSEQLPEGLRFAPSWAPATWQSGEPTLPRAAGSALGADGLHWSGPQAPCPPVDDSQVASVVPQRLLGDTRLQAPRQ